MKQLEPLVFRFYSRETVLFNHQEIFIQKYFRKTIWYQNEERTGVKVGKERSILTALAIPK